MALRLRYLEKDWQVSTTVTKELSAEEFIELAERHRGWIKESRYLPPTVGLRKRGIFIVVIEDGNLHLTPVES